MVEPLVANVAADHVDFVLDCWIGAEFGTCGPWSTGLAHTADALRLLCRRLCALFALSIGQSALSRGLLVIRQWTVWLHSTQLNSCLLARRNIERLALLFGRADLCQSIL